MLSTMNPWTRLGYGLTAYDWNRDTLRSPALPGLLITADYIASGDEMAQELDDRAKWTAGDLDEEGYLHSPRPWVHLGGGLCDSNGNEYDPGDGDDIAIPSGGDFPDECPF